jgi:hypothetical protein
MAHEPMAYQADNLQVEPEGPAGLWPRQLDMDQDALFHKGSP